MRPIRVKAAVAALGILILSRGACSGEDLFRNGDFEQGAGSWVLAGNAEVISDKKIAPTPCVQLGVTDSGGAGLSYKANAPLKTGHGYRLSGDIRYRDLLGPLKLEVTYKTAGGKAVKVAPLQVLGHHYVWWMGAADWEPFRIDLFPAEGFTEIGEVSLAIGDDIQYNVTAFWGKTSRKLTREVFKVKDEFLWLDNLKLERTETPNRYPKPQLLDDGYDLGPLAGAFPELAGGRAGKEKFLEGLRKAIGGMQDKIKDPAVASKLMEALRISDEAFFDALNLDHPGLEETKKRVSAKDYKGARVNLQKYFQEKRAPVRPMDRYENAVWPRPASAAQNDPKLKGIEENIRQIPRNPHHFVTEAALGIWNAGADHMVAQLNQPLAELIIGNGPFPGFKEDGAERWNMGWGGVNHAYGVAVADFGVFASTACSPELSNEVFINYLKFLFEYTTYILRFCGPEAKAGNWFTARNGVLLSASGNLLEFKDNPHWRKAFVERMNTDVVSAFLADGCHYEQAMSYQQIMAGDYYRRFSLAKRIGIDLGKRAEESYQMQFRHLVVCMKPGGELPPLNDSEHERPWGNAHFALRDQELLKSLWKGAAVPPFTSVGLPYAGRYVMRTGWDPKSLYLIFDAGPMGKCHNQEDKLSFLMSAYGADFLADSGRGGYGDFWHTAYYADSSGHSTVLVDGKGQRGHIFPCAYIGRHRQPPEVWAATAGFDYAEGIYNLGFGLTEDIDSCLKTHFRRHNLTSTPINVSHWRGIFFVKPDYWIIADRLEGKEGEEHTFQSLFLFYNGVELQVAREKNRVLAPHGKGPVLEFVRSRGWDSEQVYKGHIVEKPEGSWARGYYAKGTPTPQLEVVEKRKLPHSAITVLYPHPSKDFSPATEARPLSGEPSADSDGAEVICEKGKDLLIVSFDMGKRVTQGPLALVGRAGVVRTKDGKPSSVFLVRGKLLEGAGVSVKASPEATVSFVEKDGKWTAENGSSFAVDVELKVGGASALKEKLAAGSLVTLPELAQKK